MTRSLMAAMAGWLIGAALAIADDPTKPATDSTTTLSFAQAPARVNDRFPLSDQANRDGWVLSEEFSDEFVGPALDTDRWFPNNPGWKGREPTLFHSSNVTLQDGELVLRLNRHGDEALPTGFTHTAGFIKSRKAILYGYFEAEMKLMNATWVSGYWLSMSNPTWWTEIDICENCPGVPKNRHDLNSNVHVFRAPPEHGNVTKHFALSKVFRVPFELQADYHVWGLEWDQKVIRFYLDGVMFREQANTHWHQPLAININCESNRWFGALPNDEGIDQEFRIKYSRVWRKPGTETPPPPAAKP